MAITVADADTYFNTNVFHNEPWIELDEASKQRALNNAETILYRFFKRYDKNENPLPDEAVFEQALWIIRQDESIQAAEMGVMQVSVKGVSVLTNGQRVQVIAPNVLRIVNGGSVRYGRSII